MLIRRVQISLRQTKKIVRHRNTDLKKTAGGHEEKTLFSHSLSIDLQYYIWVYVAPVQWSEPTPPVKCNSPY